MSINKRFPNGVPISFHTDHRCENDKITVEKLPTLEAAFDRAEEVLKQSGQIYCARLWECGVPFNTLYWNGTAVFYRNTCGMISRERAAGVIVSPGGDDWTDPQEEDGAGPSAVDPN